MNALSRLDREIIRRFYFEEQPKHQIRRELQLSDTQFRLRKSRAINRAKLRFRNVLSIRISSYGTTLW